MGNLIKSGACVMVCGVYTSIASVQNTEFGTKLLLSGWNAPSMGEFGSIDCVEVWRAGRKSRFVKVYGKFHFEFVGSNKVAS